MSNSPIGLLGVGLLGTALSERMLQRSFMVLGFDLQPTQLQRLETLGGRAAASAQEVADACEQIVLCLPDSQVVAAVVDQLAARLRSGQTLIDATTGDPDESQALAQRLEARGIDYVDATIAGSSEQVRRGEAVVIIGGNDAAVRRAQPILSAWSDRRFHVGPAGSGARLKLVVNLVLGLNRAALAEGLSLAKDCGIDPSAALEVLRATPAYSRIMDAKGPKMLARDYSPQARLAQHLKDVRLIRELAQRNRSRTPLSDVHEQLLQRAVELGFGDADNSAVIEAFANHDAR